jgi:hypothetical protein
MVMTKLKHRLYDWVATWVPTCEVITERISLAQDGRLSLWDRFMTRLHLVVCHWCTKYHKQVTFITETTRARAKDDVLVEASRTKLSSDARARMMQRLRDADGS